MRLIDADAVIKKQREIMESLYVKTIPELKEHMGIDDALSIYIHSMESYARAKQFYHGLRGILENAPTVDAVPITRCKDCKWCEFWDSCKEYKCWHIGDGKIITVEPNGYCSCGEYRTNTGGMTHE